MSGSDRDLDFEFLDPDSLTELNYQQTVLYQDLWTNLIEFLRQKGKNPKRNRGFAESNIRPIARRIHQAHQYCWTEEIVFVELSPCHADEFVDALNDDEVVNKWGNEYSEGSKRKFTEALESYFDYLGEEWKPEINFSNTESSIGSDPFILREREQLLKAASEYKSPPTYKNVSPEERDRWNAHLAQYLGIPKEDVGPADWEELQQNWKFPSLISTALDCAWRAEMVGRLETHLVNLQTAQINIPPEYAVKNDKEWTSELSKRSTLLLKRWFEQRANKPKYDDVDHIWLNRKGNPYNSKTLNTLLDNLMEEAGIEANGRKLTWHSIRHSTGMYVYNQEKDLELTAEILRNASLEATRRYAHPTPEVKTDVIESIQGSVSL